MKRFNLSLLGLSFAVLFAPQAAAQARKPPAQKPTLVLQKGHSGFVYTAPVLSKDGKWLVTGGQDGKAILWEVATGREVRTFHGHHDEINAVALSDDGKWLATCSGLGLLEIDEAKNTVRLADASTWLWNVVTGKRVRGFAGYEGRITGLAFSHDGKQLAAGGSDGKARVWDTATGKHLLVVCGPAEDHEIDSVVFSQNGKWLVTADNRARVWNLATGKQIAEFPPQPKRAEFHTVKEIVYIHNGKETKPVEQIRVRKREWSVSHFALSSDGRFILAVGQNDRRAVVWETTTGKSVCVIEDVPEFSTCMFSHDGNRLVTASADKTVKIWDLANQKVVQQFKGNLNWAQGLALSRDGQRLFTTDQSLKLSLGARMWDVATGKQVRVFEGLIEPVNSVSVSNDGNRLVVAGGGEFSNGDKTVQLWDLSAGKQVRVFKGHKATIFSVAISADGKRLASGSSDETARVWNVDTGKELRTIEGHSGWVSAVALSPDGKSLVAGSGGTGSRSSSDDESGFAARSFRVDTGAKVRFFGQESRSDVFAVNISKDGRWLATGAADKMPRLWDMSTGKLIREFPGHEDSVHAVRLSADRKLLVSGSSDCTARLWDTATGKQLRTFKGHTNSVFSVALSRDEKLLVTGSLDGTARLCELATGRPIRIFHGHTEGIMSVALSPDGKHLITGSLDGTTRIWNVSTGQELCALVTLRDGTWVVFDKDGRFDSNNGAEVSGLHWVAGMETFAMQHRDPGLLAKHLGYNREPLRPVIEE